MAAEGHKVRPLPPPLPTPSEGAAFRWRRADELTDSDAPTAAMLPAKRCGPGQVASMPGLPHRRLPDACGEAASWLFRLTAKPHSLLDHFTAAQRAA